MINLIEKCDNPVYHQSIKFYFHRLESEEKKINFINEVASINILLASQCIMSDKLNENIEEQIKELAIKDARSFHSGSKSSNGLLALAEFELYDIILLIFNSIEKLDKFHISVLNQVFYQADKNTYLKFLETFTNSKKIGTLLSTFISYKGDIHIDNHSKIILYNFISKLIKEDYGGFLILYFDKYSLWDKVEIIFNTKVDNIISKLLNGNVGSVRLAFNLVINLNLSSKYPPINFIERLTISKFGNTKKAIALALQIANANSIYNCSSLNKNIIQWIERKNNNFKMLFKKFNYLKKKGLMLYAKLSPEINDYLLSNELLAANISHQSIRELSKIDNEFIKYEINPLLVSEKFDIQKIFKEEEGYLAIKSKYSQEIFWSKVFDYYLDDPLEIYIDNIIPQVKSLYNTDYKTICAHLSLFKQKGIIQAKKEFGYYIFPITFKASNLCFMHISLNGVLVDNNPKAILSDYQEIEFKIVGFNENTKRINVYLI